MWGAVVHDAEDAAEASPARQSVVVIVLCPGAFSNQNLVDDIFAVLSQRRKQARGGMTLLPFFSPRLPFAKYVETCPRKLREAGLLSIMFEKWPESEALQVAIMRTPCDS